MLIVLVVAVLVSNAVAGSRWGLSSKNVVITGGTKGIGKACVEEFMELGADVLTCSRSQEDVDALVAHMESKGYGGSVTGIVADLSTSTGREALVGEAQRCFGGRLDCLVNNVGSNIRKKAIEFSEADYNKVMQTNLDSCFYLCTALHPMLKAAPCASVVNMGSVSGGIGIAMSSGVVYAMTKAAMNQLTYNLACEWGKDNIRINAVSPWYVRTPLTEPVLMDAAYRSRVLATTPLGRVGEVEEVAALTAFLCMDAASYVTGQHVAVDGGFSRCAFFDLAA